MDFADRVKRHMAGYKRKVLNVEEDGVWRGKKYPHILPKNLKVLNVIEKYRNEFYCSNSHELTKKKFHQNYHHLNSFRQCVSISFIH